MKLTRTQRKWLIWIACNPDTVFPIEFSDYVTHMVPLHPRCYVFMRHGWTITDAGLEALASYDPEIDENAEKVAD